MCYLAYIILFWLFCNVIVAWLFSRSAMMSEADDDVDIRS
jgi:hypothetical protein